MSWERPKQSTVSESTEAPKGWRVAEQFSEAKDAEKGSEDGHLVSENCIAVLDGVSSPNGAKNSEGLTPAQVAVAAGLRTLREHQDINSQNVVEQLTQSVRAALTEFREAGTPSFVFVAFFPKENVIVRVGDCSYLIDGSGTNNELQVDRVRAVLRKRAVEKHLARGTTAEKILADDPMRPRMNDLRNWQDHFTNNPDSPEFGYGVIDGTDVPELFVERIVVPEHARSIVLASDGYPPTTLHMTMRESEEALSKLQQEDPLGVKTGSIRALLPTKEGQTATDDRTYLRVER
jgi:hypothetical protein